jgi:hypothetical protein
MVRVIWPVMRRSTTMMKARKMPWFLVPTYPSIKLSMYAIIDPGTVVIVNRDATLTHIAMLRSRRTFDYALRTDLFCLHNVKYVQQLEMVF